MNPMTRTGARTAAREAALQMLYAIEAANEPAEHVIHHFWRQTPGDPEGRTYATDLVRGIVGRLSELDARIGAASANWRVERMARVDRNVLRIGTFELLEPDGAPAAVILDEAIELAKRFGSEDSGKFVNGVLEKIKSDISREGTAPRPRTEES